MSFAPLRSKYLVRWADGSEKFHHPSTLKVHSQTHVHARTDRQIGEHGYESLFRARDSSVKVVDTVAQTLASADSVATSRPPKVGSTPISQPDTLNRTHRTVCWTQA